MLAPTTLVPAPGGIGICVATLGRPQMLDDLLRSLPAGCGEHGPRVTVVVVDNDPSGSARGTVEEFARTGGLEVRYGIEPVPGIAAARNRTLADCPEVEFVVFVDDDETVQVGWLDALLSCHAATGADVVTGPVDRVPVGQPPSWYLDGRFIRAVTHATGTELATAATSNTLVRREVLRFRPETFDLRFGLTGGSDTELFIQLRLRGSTIVWCEEARVSEVIPVERQTLRWVTRRGVRVMALSSMLHRRVFRRGPWRRQLMVRVAFHGGLACADTVRGLFRRDRARLARAVLHLAMSYGVVRGVLSGPPLEYAERHRACPADSEVLSA